MQNNYSQSSKIDMFDSSQTRNALVSNKNVILYYHYLKNEFDKGSKKLSDNLFKDDFEKNYFLNKDEWCTLEAYVGVVERAIELTGNFEITKIVGALLPKYQKEYRLQEFKEKASHNLKAFFWGPVEIFKQISFYNYLFNKTKTMHFLYGRNGECLIKVKFLDGVDPVFDFVSEWHIEGMLNSIIEIFGINEYEVRTFMKEYDLQSLIEKRFTGIKKKCRIEKGNFYLENDIIAKKVSLISENIKKEKHYLGLWTSFDENSKHACVWKIEKDVYMDAKYLVLKKGDLYNAPYFLTSLIWRNDNYLKAFSKLMHAQWTEISPMGRDYERLIQDRLKQEQEATRLRQEKQKIEDKYNQLLLKNYIHPRFISIAKEAPIPFKNVDVTSIFLDINNSTQLRKKYGNELFRVSKNILLRLVKEALRETDQEWGWLNKVMGDGCYVVFGAYNYFKKGQDHTHVYQALNFAVSLCKKIEKEKEGNQKFMKDFSVRFGIENGIVEIGEAYEQFDLNTPDILDTGSLRVFDTDGHSVSLAFRIESTSKIILDKLGRKRDGAILLGPSISGLVKKGKKKDYRINEINLDDIEVEIRDYGKIRTVGELVIE